MAPVQLGKWLVLFCDEINLPDMDNYGTVTPSRTQTLPSLYYVCRRFSSFKYLLSTSFRLCQSAVFDR